MWGQAAALNPSFAEDKNGNLWIGGNGGVTRFDGKNFVTYTEKDGLASINVVSVSEDAYGNIWVGTRDNGVSKIGNADLVELERWNGYIADVALDKSNTVWVSTTEGIGKYNNDHIAYYGKELLAGNFHNIWIDHKDNLWFSNHDFDKPVPNLIKFDGIGYSTYEKEQGLALDHITEILEDDANNLWLMGEGRVVKFDGSSFASYDSAQGFKGGSRCV